MSRQNEVERRTPPEAEALPRKVFVANRGQIALRILDACVASDIGCVVGFSDSDRDSPAVKNALVLSNHDSRYGAIYLGGDRPDQSYMNVNNIINSAYASDCTDIDPGIGFTSEDPLAAQAFVDAGFTFIGPDPRIIAELGDKNKACERAEKLGMRTLRISDALRSAQEAVEKAKGHDEVILKAAIGGGGGGNRRVTGNDAQGIKTAYDTLVMVYGDVHMERVLRNARHIEVQVGRDRFGDIFTDTRDCSVQIGDQKRIEVAPPQGVAPNIQKSMMENAALLLEDVGYVGLGTVEFLVDRAGNYFFIEVNTRLQVEHPVSEMRINVLNPQTGQRKRLDMVKLSLELAVGESLPAIEKNDTVVIETRIVAENTDTFTPVYGKIDQLQLPRDPDTRCDFGYEAGSIIPRLDTMLGAIVTTGETLEEAVVKQDKALDQLIITGEGIYTNSEFLRWRLHTTEFLQGRVTTTASVLEWQQYQTEIGRRTDAFFENGTFAEMPKPLELDLDHPSFPNMVYEHRGRMYEYREVLRQLHKEFPDHCAFRYGIYAENPSEAGKQPERIAVGYVDTRYMGGTLGVEEVAAMDALFDLANREGLDILLILNGGGIRNQEGYRGLNGMDYMAYLIDKHPQQLVIVSYFGNSFGGTTAALDSADIRIYVKGARGGLSGPILTAALDGAGSPEELPPDHHSAQAYFTARQAEQIANSPQEAMQMALHIASISSGRTYNLYVPQRRITSFVSDTPVQRYDRPPQHLSGPAFIRSLKDSMHHARTIFESVQRRRRQRRYSETIVTQKEPTNIERFKALNDPNRTILSDLFSQAYGAFDDVAELSHNVVVEEVEQPPAIVAAFARIDDLRLLIVGEQPIRKVGPDGALIKDYPAQGPEDFRWAERMIDLAVKRELHLVLVAGTKGAKADLAANYGGINSEISYMLRRTHQLGIPVTFLNLDLVGSGGGLPFARRGRYSADTQAAMTVVAELDTQRRIVSGDMRKVPTQAEIDAIAQQQKGTPENKLRDGFIDEIIPEPEGGPQNDPKTYGKAIRDFLIRSHRFQSQYTPEQLIALDRRLLKEAMFRGTKPVSR